MASSHAYYPAIAPNCNVGSLAVSSISLSILAYLATLHRDWSLRCLDAMSYRLVI